MPKGKIKVNFTKRNLAYSGETVLVGTPDRYSTIDYASIVAYAAKAAHVPESNIEMAMEALFDSVNYFVLNGHSVMIPYLGTLRFAINAKSTDDPDVSIDRLLRQKKIMFLPNPDLRAELNAVQIEGVISEEDKSDMPIALPKARQVILQVDNSAFATLSNNGDINRNVCDIRSIEDGAVITLSIYADGAKNADSYSINLVTANESGQLSPITLTALPVSKSTAIVKFAKPTSAFCITEVKATAVSDAQEWSGTEVFHYDGYNIANGGKIFSMRATVKGSGIVAYNGGAFDSWPFGTVVDVRFAVIGGTEGINTEFEGLEITAIGDSEVRGTYTLPAEAGQVNFGTTTNPFWIYVTDTRQKPVVSSCTANGMTVLNGASSPVLVGGTYVFDFKGQNLESLAASNFLFPEGSVVNLISASSTMVTISVSNIQAGAVKVNSRIGILDELFAMTLTEGVGPDWRVTNIEGLEPGVIYLRTGFRVPSNQTYKFEGTNLSGLTTENIVANGAAISIVSVTATSDTEIEVEVNEKSTGEAEINFVSGDLTVYSQKIKISYN